MEINPSLDTYKITFKMNNFESKAILTLKESRSNDSASIQNPTNHKVITSICKRHYFSKVCSLIQKTGKE